MKHETSFCGGVLACSCGWKYRGPTLWDAASVDRAACAHLDAVEAAGKGDTPETDAVLCDLCRDSEDGCMSALVEHARKLERRLRAGQNNKRSKR